MIERLRLDHAAAVLVFERENRAYFAASVPDRGDDYFTGFQRRFRDLLAEQHLGVCHFHVVVGDNGEVLGRVNLVDVADGSAELGFRVAAKVAGQGLATAAVSRLCAMAARDYGLRNLRAAAAADNVGSQTVLSRVGFVPTGEDVLLDGRSGHRYLLSLAAMNDPDIRAQAQAGAPAAMLSLALRLEGQLDQYADNRDAEQQIENLLRGAAEHGLPRALAELGSFLWLVREDDEEAVPWLLRAADEGQADAMNLLGDVYDFREEPGTAIAWYTKAAELGDEKAAQSLAALRDT